MKYFTATCCFIFFALVSLPFAVAAQQDDSITRIRAQLTPYQKTTLSSEISANISRLPLREGQKFKRGENLISFDCALQEAQLRKAEAIAEVARQGLIVNKRLRDLNSISDYELNQSQAKVKETEAELDAMKVLISKCLLVAPYGGQISKLHVDAFQYVTPGTPLMDIIETGRLEVRLIVPSLWLKWIKPGSQFSLQVEEVNKAFNAEVIRLGARIDPVSQTLPVIGRIEGRQTSLLPGMSGWASFDETANKE